MAEPEDVLSCAAGIGIVLPNGQGALMVEQSVQNVSCLASVSRDYLGVERCKPVGDVGIELYAWFRPVVGVVIGAGLAVAASPEELPSDEEVSPSPQRAVNGWAWMASTRQARAAW